MRGPDLPDTPSCARRERSNSASLPAVQAHAQLAHSQLAHWQFAQPQLVPVRVVHSQGAHLQVPQPQGDCWVAAVDEAAAWMLVAGEVISALQRRGW